MWQIYTERYNIRRENGIFTGYIKYKKRTFIMNKQKILQLWNDYTGKLFQDKREEKPTIHKKHEKIRNAEI